MRWFVVLFITIATVLLMIASKRTVAIRFGKNERELPVTDMRKSISLHLKKYSSKVKTYSNEYHFNTRYCFLVDMKMPSGAKRFFIYDLKNDSVLHAGLVANGSGINNLKDSVIYSNEPGSNCTSLGKYRIGKSYYGKFGLAWKLYGLDKTNSNAFNRFVVLHAHPCVPDNEIAGGEICQSWGCPTVSPGFLNQVKTYLDQSSSPVLMWIFN